MTNKVVYKTLNISCAEREIFVVNFTICYSTYNVTVHKKIG